MMPNLPPALERKYVQLRELPPSVKETIKPCKNKVIAYNIGMILTAADRQFSNLSRTGGNHLWSENPRRQWYRDSSTSSLFLSPLELRSEFGLSWSSFFLFFFLQIPNCPAILLIPLYRCRHCCTKDKRVFGSQEDKNPGIRTWTSSARWIEFQELTSLFPPAMWQSRFPLRQREVGLDSGMCGGSPKGQ